MIPGRMLDRHMCPQYLRLYRKDGTCRVDCIGRFERLNEDFEPIREKYNYRPLPHYNRSSKKDYRDYYTLATARMVYLKYRKDIKAFGYEEDYRKLIAYIKNKKNGK